MTSRRGPAPQLDSKVVSVRTKLDARTAVRFERMCAELGVSEADGLRAAVAGWLAGCPSAASAGERVA